MNSWMHLRYWSSVGLLPERGPGWPGGASASRISSAMRARRSLREAQSEGRPVPHGSPPPPPDGTSSLRRPDPAPLRRPNPARTHNVTMSALASWMAILSGSCCSWSRACWSAPRFKNRQTWLRGGGDELRCTRPHARPPPR